MGRLWVWWATKLRHRVEKDQITVGAWGWVGGGQGREGNLSWMAAGFLHRVTEELQI